MKTWECPTCLMRFKMVDKLRRDKKQVCGQCYIVVGHGALSSSNRVTSEIVEADINQNAHRQALVPL